MTSTNLVHRLSAVLISLGTAFSVAACSLSISADDATPAHPSASPASSVNVGLGWTP